MQWNKEILRGARLKTKLSQTALASELGVHFRIVQNWEKRNNTNPDYCKSSFRQNTRCLRYPRLCAQRRIQQGGSSIGCFYGTEQKAY